MFSDFVVAALDEITKTRRNKSARTLKSSWMRCATQVANEMNITLNFTRDNWYLVENRIHQLRNESIVTTASIFLESISSSQGAPASLTTISSSQRTPDSLTTISSSQRTTSSGRSKSSLGTLLSEADKKRVLASYNSLDVTNTWKLQSSNRYLENIMKTFCEESNYLNNVCSMIINLEDENWEKYLIDKESEDIYKIFNRQHTQLPDDMRLFLDAIPVSDNIGTLFNHIAY